MRRQETVIVNMFRRLRLACAVFIRGVVQWAWHTTCHCMMRSHTLVLWALILMLWTKKF